jgi:hypothetical protein
VTQLHWTPSQTIPLSVLPNEPDIRPTQSTLVGLVRVLRPVKDQHLPAHGFGRDQIRVLRHVSRAVDLAGVVDSLNDGDARRGRECMAAELTCRVRVRCAGELVCTGGGHALGNLDGRDLEVVLRLAGGVCAEEESVDRVWLVWGTDMSMKR